MNINEIRNLCRDENIKLCFFCKGDMVSGHNTHFLETSHCMVIIKNVPCFKCSQCGEVAYSLAIVRQLEEMCNTVKTAKTEVVIMNYQNDVA